MFENTWIENKTNQTLHSEQYNNDYEIESNSSRIEKLFS